MSKKEKVTEQKEQKVVTKYDLKMKKRQEQKEREKRQQRIEMLVGVVVVAAIVCLIASFPIRSYLAVHDTVVKINGEKVSRIEFDYKYNVVKNKNINQYGSYLSLFGLDTSADLSTQMYSDTLSWQDYFEQQAVDSIVRGKALRAEAEAEGFTYDVTQDYEEYKEGIKEAAESSGVSTKEYIKAAYGSYATMGRVEEYIKDSLYVSAYYDKMSEEKAPSDDEIQTYYEENKSSYDSVDYYLTTVDAELPTEPTELADPVEETDETETTDGTESAEETYQPSEAEIEKAMADAKVLADAAVDTVTTEGELKENMQYTDVTSVLRTWLFDETRTEGDTTVIEDTTNNRYHVLSFVKRYLDETPSANARIITTADGNADAILEEWKNGEATEESFGVLADKYNEGTSFTAEGGYYEAITASGTQEAMAAWLFDESRAAGDTTVVDTGDGNAYVLYYAGANDPEWKLTVRDEILGDTMENYLQEISKNITVEDTEGNLNYLAVQEAEEAAASAEADASEAAGTEPAETETIADETAGTESAEAETTADETAGTESAEAETTADETAGTESN